MFTTTSLSNPQVCSFSSNAQVKLAVQQIYEMVRTFSMSLQQFEDLYDLQVARQARHSSALTAYGAGMLDALIHIISAEHCEVVCKGADGATCKGANGAGTALRWKGTDFLFIGFTEGL